MQAYPEIPRRTLGRTGLQVSALSFGCGPIANLMTDSDHARQIAVLQHALNRGVNWIDTAATYGQGQSERSVGQALRATHSPHPIHIATKVRLLPEQLGDICGAVRRSLESSLERLGVSCVTLLQLHNAITTQRGDEATSIVPHDVLGPNGVLQALRQLQNEGLIRWIGITGIGHAAVLREVIGSGEFDTIQVPYNLLNASAGREVDPRFRGTNYGNVITLAQEKEMGVFVIRVFAAGALLGHSPGPHTKTSPFFTLDLYRRDQQAAAELSSQLGEGHALQDLAVRFALRHTGVSSAIIGFSQSQHIDDAIASLRRGPVPERLLSIIAGASGS